METRTEAPEVVGSLATLSGFYEENSAAARRRLRSTIENRGVAVNEEFLEAAEGVIQVGAGALGAAPESVPLSRLGPLHLSHLQQGNR